MIKNISIENFKSIKNLNFEARRVNIFIGEPNTGKSNILEALGLFSLSHNYDFVNQKIKLADFVRFKDTINLFHRNNINKSIIVKADKQTLIADKGIINEYDSFGNNNWKESFFKENRNYFKYYRFKILSSYQDDFLDYLLPPFGNNLYNQILTNQPLREIVAAILKDKGFRLNLETKGSNVNVSEEIDDVIYTYPFDSLSDTLQRVIFYLAAMLSNKNSALIFEEPESHIFPFYNQYLAETIGLDEESGNQYFIATHNPYFLGSIAQKTKIEDLAVFITYMENHETKLRQLRENEYPELFDFDIFYNLDRFIEA
jgi:AAA15 family ATPase/GTPase